MAKSRVIDRNHGYKAAIRRLVSVESLSVHVGVHEDAPPSEDGVPVAEYAAINEFGSEDGRVPERSFLRSTVERHRAKYAQQLEDSVDDALDGLHLKVGLARLGHLVVADVRETIESGVPPANAPSTIERKGHGATLQDSGNLSDAITAKVEVTR